MDTRYFFLHLSPQAYNVYSKVIDEELVPMHARLNMKDLRTYHIQQFVQYLATEKKSITVVK